MRDIVSSETSTSVGRAIRVRTDGGGDAEDGAQPRDPETGQFLPKHERGDADIGESGSDDGEDADESTADAPDRESSGGESAAQTDRDGDHRFGRSRDPGTDDRTNDGAYHGDSAGQRPTDPFQGPQPTDYRHGPQPPSGSVVGGDVRTPTTRCRRSPGRSLRVGVPTSRRR